LSDFSAKKRTAKYEGHDNVTATKRQMPNAPNAERRTPNVER
jgi:hypothetical protein